MKDVHGRPIFVQDLPPKPKSRRQAQKRPDWKNFQEAEERELKSIADLQVYEEVNLPQDRSVNIINSMFVYDYKVGPNGELYKYKARLVAIGSSQEEGVDYKDVFSPVIRVQVVRLMIALSVLFGLEIDQMDVSTAFLYAKLKDECYMRCPPGKEKPGRCWKLLKCLYGLHQSPQEWYLTLKGFLVGMGYTVSEAAVCLFWKVDQKTKKLSFVMVYVDDLMIVSSESRITEELKNALKSRFQMTDLGKAEWVLKVHLHRLENGDVWIGQPQYAQKILSEAGMWDADVPIKVAPMSVSWTHDEESKKLDAECAKQYHSWVMMLAYLAQTTRPDILYTVNRLAGHQQDPRECDWNALYYLMCYLKGAHDLGIRYRQSETADVLFATNTVLESGMYPEIYGDSSFAEDDGFKSRSGFVFMMAGGAIFWYSKKQSLVALSSTEAEYYALSETAKEAIWLRNVLSEIGLIMKSPFEIKQDNQSTIAIAVNPIAHARTKHIGVKMHHIRNHISRGDISVAYCPTEDMIADILTKALAAPQHWRLVLMMGMARLSDLDLHDAFFGFDVRDELE